MIPHANKYGSNKSSRQDIIEKRKQQKREQMVKQKDAELKAAVLLAIIAISIQSVAFVLALIPATVSYTILPGILGLLVGGMAIGLVHSDKKKKAFVYIIFTANILIGIYSGYKFIESTHPSQEPVIVTKKDSLNIKTLNSSFQEKMKEKEIQDSLENAKALQENDTSTVELP